MPSHLGCIWISILLESLRRSTEDAYGGACSCLTRTWLYTLASPLFQSHPEYPLGIPLYHRNKYVVHLNLSHTRILTGWQIVNPGLHTPFEHLKYCVSLAHLVQSIRHNLYIGPIQEGCKLSQSNFEEAMKSLKRWRASIPQHLDLTSSSLVAPCHHRPIALLQLRYLAAVMLVTRPFLLCSLLRGGELNGTPKLRYFEGLAKTCVSATEAAIDVLEIMLGQGTLSSLILFDFLFALQVTQLGLTASGLFGSEAHNIHPQRCLNVLKKIGESGYPKQLLPETLYQLQKVGLRDDALLDPAVGALPHNEIAVDSGRHLEGNPRYCPRVTLL